MKLTARFAIIFVLVTFLNACQGIHNFSNLKEKSASLLGLQESDESSKNVTKNALVSKVNLSDLLTDADAVSDLELDFITAINTALKNDPTIVSRQRSLVSKMAKIEATVANKEFQVSGSLYGGVEDITDEIAGLALVLNASKVIYDGGKLDAQISADRLEAESARYELMAHVDARALEISELWIELEKYEALNGLISSRLEVLDPLISQLEEVAKAGIGDVSSVAAAQRTVSNIRVAQTNVSEKLEQARLNFLNGFGDLPQGVFYDADLIKRSLPNTITEDLVYKSPALLAKYEMYKSELARVEAVRAKEQFQVGFEARASRPFGGSDYSSDESIGLVARKTLFNGGKIESEVAQSLARAEAIAEELRAIYRRGDRVVKTASQNITSMEKAILLAKKNAQVTADEINYLRQQLVIGGSTLDSVLSAEARLYEAESKEIGFVTEMRKSELSILAALGLLGTLFDVGID